MGQQFSRWDLEHEAGRLCEKGRRVSLAAGGWWASDGWFFFSLFELYTSKTVMWHLFWSNKPVLSSFFLVWFGLPNLIVVDTQKSARGCFRKFGERESTAFFTNKSKTRHRCLILGSWRLWILACALVTLLRSWNMTGLVGTIAMSDLSFNGQERNTDLSVLFVHFVDKFEWRIRWRMMDDNW